MPYLNRLGIYFRAFSAKVSNNVNAKLSQNRLSYMYALSPLSSDACKYLCETFVLFSSCELNAKTKECFESSRVEIQTLSNSHSNIVESRTIAILHSRKQLANSQKLCACVFVLVFDENAHNKSCASCEKCYCILTNCIVRECWAKINTWFYTSFI